MLGPELVLPSYDVEELETQAADAFRRWPESHNELLMLMYNHWSLTEWMLVGNDETLEWQVGSSDLSKMD